jgi:hypothetical protein
MPYNLFPAAKEALEKLALAMKINGAELRLIEPMHCTEATME